MRRGSHDPPRSRRNHGDEGAQRDDERRHERALLGRERQQARARRRAGPRRDRRLPGARHGREPRLHHAAATE